MEIKERIDKVDDRSIMLFKKYPFVGALVLIVGALIGFAIGVMI